MNRTSHSPRHCLGALLLALTLLSASANASAGDAAQLVSQAIPAGTQVMPRTVITQSWTFQNTGTTTWTAGYSGYTLNLVGRDSLGAVPLAAKTSRSYTTSASIASGTSVAPGGQATYSLTFIAPEAPGTYTDTFQPNSSGSVFFGPQVTIQIVVPKAGSTNQYDRARAVSYANNYVGYVVGDGCFWTSGSTYTNAGVGAPVPTYVTGDDCAHFVSCCIGSQPHEWGGGLTVPSRGGTYGEPGAGRLVNTVLIGGGWATEVSSLSSMMPGDVIGWNWSGDPDIANLDHVTLYLGNGLLASHAASCLETSANTWYQSSYSHLVRHLVHIYDAPTLAGSRVGTKLVLSWRTNWTGYVLYSSTSLSPSATWNKVLTTPVTVGTSKMVTNNISTGAVFYRLMHP